MFAVADVHEVESKIEFHHTQTPPVFKLNFYVDV